MSEAETIIESEQFDESLQDDLDQLEYYSHGDYVEVKVTSVERLGDDEVLVNFEPPAGEAFSRKMEIPVDPSYDTEFTRLLDSAGFNYSTASNIVDERVPFRYTEDGWEHVYIPYDNFVEKHIMNLRSMDLKQVLEIIAIVGGVATFPVSGLLLILWASVEEDEDVAAGVLLYLMMLFIWLFVFFLIQPIL